MVQHEEERVVVLRSEDLANECASLFEDLGRKFEGVEGQLNLHVGIQVPISSHIGGTIVEYSVTLEVLQLFLDEGDAPWSCNIALESHAAFDWLDGVQVNTDFDRCFWHVLRSDLQPVNSKKELV